MNLKDSIASANELPAALKVGSLALGFLLSYIAMQIIAETMMDNLVASGIIP